MLCALLAAGLFAGTAYGVEATGGTGINDRDYDRLASPVLIPAGAAEVQLPVIPSFNLGAKQPKTVELSIAPGAYVMGISSTASILTRAE